MKKQLILFASIILLTGCSLFGSKPSNNGVNSSTSNSASNNAKIEAKGLELIVSQTTATKGSNLAFGCNFSPNNSTTINEETIDTDNLKWFCSTDGSDYVRKEMLDGYKNFYCTFSEAGKFSYYVKYCSHTNEDSHEGDLISNTIEIKIKDEFAYTSNILPDETIEISADQNTSYDADFIMPSKIGENTISKISQSAFKNHKELTSVRIPYGVKEIGASAFEGCTSLKYVVIPSSVTKIGNSAFRNCSSELYGFFEINDVTTISGYSDKSYNETSFNKGFNHFVSSHKDYFIENDFVFGLKTDNTLSIAKYLGNSSEVEIPSEVQGKKVASILGYAFLNKTMINSVTIPSSIESIGYNSFGGCTGLKEIILPSSVTSIGYMAFSGCTSVQSLKIPYGVKEIGASAFEGCTSLKYVVIPSSVTKIGNSAFRNCSSELYGFFEINDVTTISGYSDKSYNETSFNKGFNHFVSSHKDYFIENDFVFGLKTDNTLSIAKYLGNSSEVEIPSEVQGKKVASILGYAFLNKTMINSVTIPSSIESIGYNSFGGCTGLKEIILPSSVTSIGNYAFINCTSLTIYCRISSKPKGWSSEWNSSNCEVVWGYNG